MRAVVIDVALVDQTGDPLAFRVGIAASGEPAEGEDGEDETSQRFGVRGSVLTIGDSAAASGTAVARSYDGAGARTSRQRWSERSASAGSAAGTPTSDDGPSPPR